MKKSILLYQDQKEVFDTLTDEQAGKLIKAIFQYQENGEFILIDPLLKIIMIPIRQSIDRNSDKYDSVCKRNAENIAKRWNKDDTKNTTGKTGIPNDTKNTNNDSDNKNDSDSDREKEKKIINGSVEPPVSIDFEKLKTYWNSKAVRASKIQSIDENRKNKIRSIVKKNSKELFFKAMTNMLESSFHNLDLSETWKPNFDWLLKNFTKMLELEPKESQTYNKKLSVFG